MMKLHFSHSYEITPRKDADVWELQRQMAKLPQIELETDHYFADQGDGSYLYCRRIFRPATCTIVGKVHKKEHFYFVLSGRVLVNGSNEYKAGDVILSKPGTKRAVYALEDSICLTVHLVHSQDVEQIEKELMESDDTALFDFMNKPKQGVISMKMPERIKS